MLKEYVDTSSYNTEPELKPGTRKKKTENINYNIYHAKLLGKKSLFQNLLNSRSYFKMSSPNVSIVFTTSKTLKHQPMTSRFYYYNEITNYSIAFKNVRSSGKHFFEKRKRGMIADQTTIL